LIEACGQPARTFIILKNLNHFPNGYFAGFGRCFLSTRKISGVHQVPFGFLFAQSQWVIAPVIR
jgi:hypothetical protein